MASNSGKIIILTGATRGLGASLIEPFVKAGHTVIGCGRSGDAIRALQKKYSRPHDFQAVDVSSEHEVMGWGERVLQEFGPPDLLINNAAVINQNAPLWKVSAQEFDSVIDVNVKGIAHVVRCFVPAMVAKKSGVIVNLSSGWGRSTSPEVAPYCASKWAVEGLTLALAQELPEGMAAIPLNPGIINTEMLQSCFGEGAGRFPDAEEWSTRAAPFLLSFGPKHNGKQLTVPGEE
ncbi:MAG: SDR family NAD(P)-dependent oxidoreductase [Planctomycetales bacterium]